MAQVGTDIFAVIEPGQAMVAPVDLTLLGANAAVGTVGTTASTFVVNVNGTPTSITDTIPASAATSPEANAPTGIFVAAGAVVNLTTTLGTSAANACVTLWFQRAL